MLILIQQDLRTWYGRFLKDVTVQFAYKEVWLFLLRPISLLLVECVTYNVTVSLSCPCLDCRLLSRTEVKRANIKGTHRNRAALQSAVYLFRGTSAPYTMHVGFHLESRMLTRLSLFYKSGKWREKCSAPCPWLPLEAVADSPIHT